MKNNVYKKVLVVRTGAIGDVVHTTNLIHSLKKAYPDITLHYLTSSVIKPLLVEDFCIEKVLTINPKFNLFSSYTKELAQELKQEHYDIAINLQPSFKVKALMFLSGIKKQLTYKKNFKVHAVTNFWQTGKSTFPEMKEEKELKLYLPTDLLNKAKERLNGLKRPFIIINAGGVFSKRQGRTYPVDKWIELGNRLQALSGGTIILNGAKEDKEFLEPLSKINNSINFIGELSLEDSCAIIANADYMISGDSGPLHIACALGVKCAGLYGSMPAKRTGCYCSGIDIISKKTCVPCNRRKCKYLKNTKEIYAPCMKEIEPEFIISELCSKYPELQG